jgi:uncharacterized membrane protein (GlpM family)
VDPFLLRLGLSFLLGGTSVAAFTTIAERYGSRIGGLLLSFPVKVLITLFLIALNEGVAFAARAAVSVPAGLGVNLVFLVATALLVRRVRSPRAAVAGALAIWLVAGIIVVAHPPLTLAASLAYWLVPLAVGLFLLSRIPGVRAVRKTARAVDRFGWTGLATRALGAGTVVALSVVLAHEGGPVLGGLASVFPSGWITTMVILTRRHGPEFTASTVRVMLVGSAAPVIFGVLVALTYERVGMLWGTLAGVGAAVATSAAVAAMLHLRGDGASAAVGPPE